MSSSASPDQSAAWESLRMAVVLVGLLVALVVGHSGVYERLIVPRLPQWRHVPIGMWLLVEAPAWAVCLAAGVRLRSWKRVAAHACAAALVHSAFTFTLWRSGATGYKKAYDDGVLEAAALSLVLVPVYAMVFASSAAVARWVRKRHDSVRKRVS